MYFTPKQLEIISFIREYRKRKGYSPTLDEIAEAMDVSKITVFEHVAALERKGVISKQKYQSRSIEVVEKKIEESGIYELPLLGYIAAGRPIEAIEDNEKVDVSSLLSGRHERFALKVQGDSMIDDQIIDGDYVIVEKRDRAENGETVVALLDNGEATLKKFYKEGERIRLQPANSLMEPIYVKNVTIQGVVVGVIRKYR